jgi:hypothetical protein
MAVARVKGKLRSRQPKLSPKQQAELCRIHASGEYSIVNLAELFTVSRPTMYRTLQRSQASPGTVTLCPLASLISHVRPIFGEYFGNPWCPARMTTYTNTDSWKGASRSRR